MSEIENITRALFENALDAVIGMSEKGKITDWNQQAELMFGWSKNEAVGRKLSETLIPFRFRATHDKGLKQFLETGHGSVLNKRIEMQGLKRNGHEFPVELTVTPLRVNGAFIFYAFVRDITESKQLRTALQNEIIRAKSIVDHVIDGIITINERFQIETWNPAAKSIFGYDAAEVLGKNINMLMPEPYHSQHDTYVSNYLNTGNAKIIGIGREVVGKRKDSSTFPMDLAVSEFMIGKDRFFTGIVRDVTERKQHEEALEASIKMRDEFLSVASHELRTPLTALKLQLQLSERKLEKNPLPVPFFTKLVEAFANSLRQVNSLTKLVEELLDISRLQSGQFSLSPEEIDLNAVIRDIVSRYADQLSAAQCTITTHLAENMLGFWDHSRIEQILVNLIGNILKYAPGSKAKITTKARNDHVLLIIEDSGPGIPTEIQSKIFDRFQRGNTARNVGGLGLGLYVVKRIVHEHQGTISLESSPKTGTRFTIELPRKALRLAAG